MSWMRVDKDKLNPDKTQLLLVVKLRSGKQNVTHA